MNVHSSVYLVVPFIS